MGGLIDMILKEIQMDLPFIYNADISNEESVEIYQNTWKNKRREFQLLSRCMTAMIERLMPPINTKNYRKIVIECVEKTTKSEGIYMPGILFVQVLIDIDSFYKLNNLEKKKWIINKVLEAVDFLSHNGYYELAELIPICDFIKKSNYVNEWFWKKPIKAKDKSVQIKVLHDVDKVSIYMVFIDRNKQSKEVLLVEETPDEWAYSKYLGKLEWVSENEAQLKTKEGALLGAKCVSDC